MSELVRYDAACRAVAEARTIDEAKDIRDIAVAMRAYARQAKNKELEADAIEIRMRATRRLDQMRQAQRETIGLNKGTAIKTRVDEKPTLASQGIDKNLAHQARTLGALSEEEFEEAVTEARDTIAHVARTITHAPVNGSLSGLEPKAQQTLSELAAEYRKHTMAHTTHLALAKKDIQRAGRVLNEMKKFIETVGIDWWPFYSDHFDKSRKYAEQAIRAIE